MARRFLVLTIGILVLGATLAGLTTATPAPKLRTFEIDVGDETATGLLALPHGRPDVLVVILHGYTHNASSHEAHLLEVAERGALGVAMDYRGPQSGFPIRAGADDTIAAMDFLTKRYRIETVVMVAVSMGASVAGIVLAERPGAVDYLIASEPMANLVETWAEARAVGVGLAFARIAAEAIEAETGGTPVTVPAQYEERTTILRVDEFQGLRGAIVLHGLWDGFVPYDQGRELATVLRHEGFTTDFYNVLRGEKGAEGTCISCHVQQPVDGLAGHGTESNDTHTLTKVSWDVTYRLLEGDPEVAPANREFVVDRGL